MRRVGCSHASPSHAVVSPTLPNRHPHSSARPYTPLHSTALCSSTDSPIVPSTHAMPFHPISPPHLPSHLTSVRADTHHTSVPLPPRATHLVLRKKQKAKLALLGMYCTPWMGEKGRPFFTWPLVGEDTVGTVEWWRGTEEGGVRH